VFEFAVTFIVEIFRQVFCRRIKRRKRFYVVDHLVIESIDDVPHDFAQVFEIKEQTRFVQIFSRQCNPDLVIVAVRVFTLPLVVSEVVAGGKCVFNSDFEHGDLSIVSRTKLESPAVASGPKYPRQKKDFFPYIDVRINIKGKEFKVPTAFVTSKGQITIPRPVRDALGIDAGDRVEFVEIEKGQFAIIAATRSIQELNGKYRDRRSKPVSIEEMNAAIAKRAARSR
jgi:AbrB family looped-hinge helix DNA binding protein